MTTIEGMERFKGHLYNWYETNTLRPLYPLYISAVDSGNLAGHLVAVAAACNEWSEAPSVHLQGEFDGLLDTVTILDETLDDLPDDRDGFAHRSSCSRRVSRTRNPLALPRRAVG